MEEDGDNAFVFPLLELPAPCLRSVLLHLWMDVRDVASLSCCCKATAEACDDDQLWKELLMRRFGAGALPCEKPPAESSQPVSVEGWVFFQGMDVATDDNTFIQEGPHTMEQLAHLCDSKGSEAFTTGGRVVSKLGPSHTWKRVTLRPHEGLYVKQQVAAAMELQQQTQHTQGPAAPWPPVVPGWVYYPCCDSPGFTAKDPAANLATHSSMESLLSAALSQPNVVAVTTSGETKSKLRPQRWWVTRPQYDCGLYVKQAYVDQFALTPPTAGPRYRSFARRLQSLKLYAGQMDACWLNDQYLTLEELSNDKIGCGGTVLKLNSVWWLDISGSITGVPPGTYDVIWVTKTTRPHDEDSWTIPLSMSATAEPLQHPDPPIDTAAVSCGTAATAAAAAPPSQSNSTVQAAGGNSTVAASEGTVAGSSSSSGGAAVSTAACESEGCSSVTKTATWAAVYHPQQRPAADRSWGMISGRSITVTQLSTVHLRFWSHEHWKGNMEWAYAELRPHRSHEQQQHERQRRKQWQQWWKAHMRVQHPQQQQAQEQEQQQQGGFVFGTLSRWLRSLQQGH